MKFSTTPSSLETQLDSYSVASKSISVAQALRTRLGDWAIYGAATAAALAGATSASAEIIYSGPVSLTATVGNLGFAFTDSTVAIHAPGPLSNNQIGLYARHFYRSRQTSHSWTTTANSGLKLITRSTPAFNYGEARIKDNGGSTRAAGGRAAKLVPGSVISAGKAFWNGTAWLRLDSQNGFHQGNWGPGNVTGIAGVALNAPGGGVDYGWLRIRVQDLNSDGYPDSVTLIDYAYNNTPGQSIAAGDEGSTTPEPGTAGMLLLAAGAAGVMAWKRRRQAAA